MQQQKDHQAQVQVQYAQTQVQYAQAQAATLAGQQQMNELLGSPLSRILVNSAMTCMPVASTFVGPLPNAVSDTSLLLSMADSDMSVQPCSSSTSLSKPPLTTEVQIRSSCH